MIPDGILTQPPIPAGENPEEVGTTQWAKVLPTMKGTVRIVRVMPGLEGSTGDGAGYPAVVLWSVGGYIHENIIHAPAPAVLDLP